MKRNVIALLLVMPLMFLFVVFSSAKRVSLGVPVSANGIEILGKPEGGYMIDLSAAPPEARIEAKVLPARASEQGYVLRSEGAVSVGEGGQIVPLRVGEGRITAVSKDGGYSDSVRVFVYATKPCDLSLSLRPLGGGEELLLPDHGGYRADIPTGRYALSAQSYPAGGEVVFSGENVFYDRAAGTALLPFSGDVTLTASLETVRGGEPFVLEKRVRFTLEKVRTGSGIVVNGGERTLVLDRDSERAVFYVEAEDLPRILPDPHISESRAEPLGEGRYRMEVRFSDGPREDFTLILAGGQGEETLDVAFEAFDYSIRSGLPVQTAGRASVPVGEAISFFASPSVPAEGIAYRWTAEEGVRLETKDDGAECVVTAERPGAFRLEARAFRGGALLDLFPKRLEVEAVERVDLVRFADETEQGLAKSRAVAGKTAEGGENVLPLHPVAVGRGEVSLDSLEFSTSDENIATVEREGETLLFRPRGTGEVRVIAAWKGNESFGTDVRAELRLYAAAEAVAVRTSPELYEAAGAGKAVVLERDIALGSDGKGDPLPPAQREALLGKTLSTFNTEYYKNTGRAEEACIRYAIEFKNDVYGNGHSVNAELLTAAKDGAGQPLFFRGPLDFVRFGELASVAAQDNAAFLVRTDGVTLWNVTLLGCGDGELGEDGYDLSRLDLVGTTLDLNASVRLLNCRVRNGRNVVRCYGGNRGGERYFAETPEPPEPRAVVEISGCVLSQGREFLLKVGTNRALRATEDNVEPDLPAGDFVMTEVCLADSVLERSGFFTVGVESNFSGELLARGGEGGFDGWRGTGGTSYPSLLRLSGDVRMYDWKDLSLIDGSTLIRTELDELKLDVQAMIECAAGQDPALGEKLFCEREGARLVHGGIAFYGGGKNFSDLRTEELFEELCPEEFRINLSVLSAGEGNTGYQGQILPAAAGTQDFRFFLYAADGPFSLARQEADGAAGAKYEGIKALPPF